MNQFSVGGVLAAVLVALSACTTLVGVDPALPAEQRDQAQREMLRPAIEADGTFEIVTVESEIPVAREALSRWFMETGAPRLGQSVVGTSSLPGVARTESLIGRWRKPGDRRRIVFADGHSAVEEIVESTQTGNFRYVVWNLTNRTGRYTDYAVGEFSFTGNDQATRIRWTYSFRPKGWPDGFLIRSFVQKEYREFMVSAMTAIQKQAAVELLRD